MASPRWSVFTAVDARQAAAAFSGVPPAERGDATAPAPHTKKRGAARSGRNTRWHAPSAPRTPGPVRGPSIPRTARVTVTGFYPRGTREPTVIGPPQTHDPRRIWAIERPGGRDQRGGARVG